MNKITFIFFAFLLFFSACKPDKKQSITFEAADTSHTKVLILCEGNFTWGNAEIDLYDASAFSLISGVFKKQNSGKPLGDVLQSACMSNGLIWLVLNNSGKITGIDPKTFAYRKGITGLNSPRYMLQAGGYYWISDIYDNHIFAVDTLNLQITKKISCRGWTEQMILQNGYVWICNARGYLHKLDPVAMKITDSIATFPGCKWVETDALNRIWTLCSDSGKSHLCCVDPAKNSIVRTLSFQQDASCLVAGKNRDSLFLLSDGIRAISIAATDFPSGKWYARTPGETLYGLGVNPWNGEVYCSDAKDYVSRGNVVIFSPGAQEIRRFQSGIIPAGFLFYR